MIDTANEPTTVFCPSCAALVAERAERGALLRCPICGTEFIYEPDKTAESSVTDADIVPSSLTKRQSTEEILLDRLRNEPPQKKPLHPRSIALVLFVVLAIAFGVYKIASKPNAYAPQEAVDSLAVTQRQSFFEHIVDSLQNEIAKNPSNLDLHLQLADADYDASNWADSKKEFEIYLEQKPKDADARVDYAYAVARASGNLTAAISEIDTALLYQPDHLNALVNAGIMTAQTITDSNHEEALAKAKDYFIRARNVAKKTNPAIAARIDTLIMEIDSTGLRMKLR
ncbi:MAG TPA: hypothetical protein VGM92_13165 [Candidatus Kapabacteria bacterium]